MVADPGHLNGFESLSIDCGVPPYNRGSKLLPGLGVFSLSSLGITVASVLSLLVYRR